MSKAPKNIEKIILGVAALIAVALAALGFLKNGKVADEFSDTVPSSGGEEAAVAGAEFVPATINSLALDRKLDAGLVDSTNLPDGEREVDLFVGVPLFAQRDNPNEPVDLPTSEDVHPPIPNWWWLKYRISPAFADSPQRDEDEDGFTNLEEFEAETDPTSDDDHPPLVAKLSFVGDESVEWLLEFGFNNGDKWLPKITIDDKKGGITKNKASMAAGGYSPGDTFFEEEPFANRFKFVGFEDRQIFNERLNAEQKVKFAVYEDQRENKKGKRYEMPQGPPKAELPNFINHDRTALLDLRALGLEGKNFKVEEQTQFTLPPDGGEATYFLKEVTPEKVVVEWEEEGQTRSVEIPKGGLPDLN